MAWLRPALALLLAAAVGLAVVSGGSGADPWTPAALPGLPPPFLGVAVAGGGGSTAAVDAYGDIVDLRAPGPAGRGLIDNPSARQAAGTVAADTGIVPRVSIGGGPGRALWRADSVSQSYLPGTNVVRTVARFGRVRVRVTSAAAGEELAVVAAVVAPRGTRAAASFGVDLVSGSGARCTETGGASTAVLICGAGGTGDAGAGASRAGDAGVGASGAGAPGSGDSRSGTSGRGVDALLEAQAATLINRAAASDRSWLTRARPLGATAPAWARQMYERSLLTLHALTDHRSGAVAAGARDGWAYVWPRDAATASLALGAAGYRPEARRVAAFLLGLDAGAAARFDGNGAPVPGRAAQGDASGWIALAARATGLPSPTRPQPWRDRPDYREGPPGTYLANAIAATAQPPADGPKSFLYGYKSAHRPGLGGDAAAAWAVRPFALPALYGAARHTLVQLASSQTRFGITPGEDWPGTDPWMAPTAWAAWSFAALADHDRSSPARARDERRQALRLLADLRRAATPAGALPERVDAQTGTPRSTTPLAWPAAFAVLALHQLWPTP